MKRILFITISLIIITSCKQQINLEENVIEFYDNGNKKTIELYEQIKDKRVAKYYKEYYESQQIKIEGSLKNGKREGLWIYYYENGNKWSEGNYIDGLANGKFTQYYENGKLWMYTYYKNGEKTRAILFDEKGNVIEDNNL